MDAMEDAAGTGVATIVMELIERLRGELTEAMLASRPLPCLPAGSQKYDQRLTFVGTMQDGVTRKHEIRECAARMHELPSFTRAIRPPGQ